MPSPIQTIDPALAVFLSLGVNSYCYISDNSPLLALVLEP